MFREGLGHGERGLHEGPQGVAGGLRRERRRRCGPQAYGPRKLTIAGWMDQATTLYANLSSDARLSTVLVRFGYNAAQKGHPIKTGTG